MGIAINKRTEINNKNRTCTVVQVILLYIQLHVAITLLPIHVWYTHVFDLNNRLEKNSVATYTFFSLLIFLLPIV